MPALFSPRFWTVSTPFSRLARPGGVKPSGRLGRVRIYDNRLPAVVTRAREGGRDAGNLITVIQIGRVRENGPVTAKLCVSATTTGAAMDGGSIRISGVSETDVGIGCNLTG